MWSPILLLIGSAVASEMIWSTHPSSLVITDSDQDNELGDVQHILSVAHGFSTHKNLGFSGVSLRNPFDVPRGTVLVTLYGAEMDGYGIPGKHYKMNDDGNHISLHSLKNNAKHVYGEQVNIVELELNAKVADFDGVLERLSLGHDAVASSMDGVNLSGVNASIPSVAKMINQASLLLQTLQLLNGESSKVLDVIHVEIEIPGRDDLPLENGRAFITSLISKVQEMVVKSYEGQANVVVVSLPALGKRRFSRNILATQDSATAPGNIMQPYKEWNENSPAIFNIILWTSIGLALLVLLVAYGMANSDPGHDSIIYRMTTSRLKKD